MRRAAVTPRRLLAAVLVLFVAVLLTAWYLLHSGLARHAFYSVLEQLKGAEAVSVSMLRSLPENSPYEQWLVSARAQWPLFEGVVIDDVMSMELQAWPQMGAGIEGLYLRFADYQSTDGRLLGLAQGTATLVDRHLYEKSVYVLSGAGYVVFYDEAGGMTRLDWQAGDLFAVPLNVPHQFFGSSPEPSRLLLVTSFPLLLNLFADEAFVGDSDYFFNERFNGEADYFSGAAPQPGRRALTNVVRGLPDVATEAADRRGAGSRRAGWQMAGNSMLSMHLSEIPAGRYKKAHRHSSDAFILILSGEGFSMTWPGGMFERHQRVDWQAGTLFVPPTYWYHQHLNSSDQPARYLAINTPELIQNLGLRFSDQLEHDQKQVRDAWLRATQGSGSSP